MLGGAEEWPLNLTTEIYVFGSFARGALEPADVDIAVRYDRDPVWLNHALTCMTHGRDPYSQFKQALIGRKRGVQFHFELESVDFELTLLWRRGESLETALGRLAQITPDPAAGRAPRDAMLPEFEGLDRWLPRPYRVWMKAAVDDGLLEIERICLPDGHVENRLADKTLQFRWKAGGRLFRAARAAVAWWEKNGTDLDAVWLHGRPLGRSDSAVSCADFDLRYFRRVPQYLGDEAAKEWIASSILFASAAGCAADTPTRRHEASGAARLVICRPACAGGMPERAGVVAEAREIGSAGESAAH